MNTKPNIIFILTDQQRHDTCGCYGQSLDVTPNLANLAKKGVLFINSFTCQPVCGPARSCIQTGKYATETMCYRNGVALPKKEKTIADYLSQAGYEVGYIGKWHLASTILLSKEDIGKKKDYQIEPIPLELRGGYKDFWLASDLLELTSHPYEGHLFNSEMEKVNFIGYRVDSLTDFALDYIRTRELNQPFFLFLSYLEPHQQNDQEEFVGPENSKERFKNYDPPGDLKGVEGDWKEFFPDYLGACNSIDKNLGRIQKLLEKLKINDNTIIVFTSDHGCHFRTRVWEYKRSCHDSSIHIPLLIKGPGFPKAKKVNQLVSLIDLAPTILKCAGIEIPNYMRGRPLQELTNEPINDWPEEIFVQISESQVGRAIRTHKWKYSIKAPRKNGFLYAKSDVYVEEYLYDLENDIYEKHNLVDDPDYADIRKELASKLIEKMIEIGEPKPKILPNNAK
ncbi:MAG: sulfatase-like hydrolase/transferase [Candidatus Lokiarchaeota archaeon]|nr:sulfatase-like hydrolase/transferase [Candidatus Lokiarchaeota archaeon]MBD3342765.1 sulfatase-like hydrolase/transferase [Candidatus Lokiarchaeota archaeon]